MICRALISAIFASTACFAVTFSCAGTLTADDLDVSLTLSGEITPGDAEKIAAHFLAVKPFSPATRTYYFPNALYLNSPGGDVVEALRIADLVRSLGLTVVVVPDGKGVCASSCFLIYVAAVHREASGIDEIRVKGAKGNLGPLGIHRPYLRGVANDPSGARKQEEVMLSMRAHLAKSGVGQALIDKMMSHASNDVYWLNSEEVRSLGSYSPGVEEQLIEKCAYNAKQLAKLSRREYLESSSSGVLNCVTSYMIGAYDPLTQATVHHMRQGWRPWK